MVMVVKVVVMMMVVVPFTIVKCIYNLILLKYKKRLREGTLVVIAKAVTKCFQKSTI